ncbi:MAG: type II/IV secretion system ATPase subunit [Candidatus Thorarchaeota archaeon]|nr:type II/IV secretion system ATPase subunit [Candidatus Thorarchaeota archaeon]
MGSETVGKKRMVRNRQDVELLECPETRCVECESHRNGKCQRIQQWKEQKECDARLVILETERGYIHLAPSNTKQVKGPPWLTKEWDPAYLGESMCLSSSEIVDVYRVGAYLVYFVRDNHSNVPVHHAIPMLRTPLEHSLFEEVCMEFPQIERDSPFVRGGLNERLTSEKEIILENLSEIIPEMNDDTKTRISHIVAHRKSILAPIFPLLFDEEVEEIFLSRPGAHIYFDHCRLGRCDTEVTFSNEDVNRFMTLVRAESNFHLDHNNPSLKTEIGLADVLLRVSAAIPPLSPDGLTLEIRRARSNPFTVVDLLKNGTLTIGIAAFLISAIRGRANITITGEPGSGKTTLLNALDMMTPPHWRKLYIEDVIESRLWANHKQTRFRVPPYDEGKAGLSKTNEIVKCLHRSPDYMILGEIQTAEHSSALFQAIAAGLRTIQTCHSRNSSCLISRWRDSHGISEHEIAMMDLVITMKQREPGVSERYVAEVAKIQRIRKNGLIVFDGLTILYEKNGKLNHTNILKPDENDISKNNEVSIEENLEVLISGYHDDWPRILGEL